MGASNRQQNLVNTPKSRRLAAIADSQLSAKDDNFQAPCCDNMLIINEK
jgi:hypothetical protein